MLAIVTRRRGMVAGSGWAEQSLQQGALEGVYMGTRGNVGFFCSGSQHTGSFIGQAWLMLQSTQPGQSMVGGGPASPPPPAAEHIHTLDLT